MNLSPLFRQRFFDSNGLPLAGGQLFSYIAGTTTPQGTFSNQSGTSNTNPVILDAYGYADVWLNASLAYKFVLEDVNSNVQWTVDNVTVGGSVSSVQVLGVNGLSFTGGPITTSGSIQAVLSNATQQIFTGAPTGINNYAFTITSHAFITGDTYTNNGSTFTVLSTSATGTVVLMSGTGTPASSGTLTWASGSGSGNLTFSGFTAAYIPRAGLLYCKITVLGSGGGGGVGANTSGSAGGGGGGSGGTSITWASAATIGAGQSVVVGAGGAPSNAGNSSGVGSLAAATGGLAGGLGVGASTAIGGGGAGGTGSSGLINLAGAPGNNGTFGIAATISGNGGNGGNGVGQYGGGGGLGGNTSGSILATSGGNFGSGGGGGSGAQSAGFGAAGLVVIEEFGQ